MGPVLHYMQTFSDGDAWRPPVQLSSDRDFSLPNWFCRWSFRRNVSHKIGWDWQMQRWAINLLYLCTLSLLAAAWKRNFRKGFRPYLYLVWLMSSSLIAGSYLGWDVVKKKTLPVLVPEKSAPVWAVHRLGNNTVTLAQRNGEHLVYSTRCYSESISFSTKWLRWKLTPVNHTAGTYRISAAVSRF